MRLPGTRYQEHGWEQVRKLLGRCSLLAFARCELAALIDAERQMAQLDPYIEALAEQLRASGAREDMPGNSYGDSVLELALSLAFELQAHPGDWRSFAAAVANEHAKIGAFWSQPGGDAILRKKVNDMYAVLRDRVDSDNYQAACGRACSPNKIYGYRMLDTCYSEVARVFSAWQENLELVGAILGRTVAGIPIEVRQMKSIAGCKAEWILRWSAAQERFGSGPGPLHTRSKRFANLKDSPDKIQAMLQEIGDYEELSSNQDRDWLHDASEATSWLDDYWRVIGESEQADSSGVADRILPAPEDSFAEAQLERDEGDDDAGAGANGAAGQGADRSASLAAIEADIIAADRATETIAAELSLPPRFMEMARAAQDAGSRMVGLLGDASLPVRLAVYQKLMGNSDDSYPDAWCDPATGELPTMAQLAALDQVSLPTLRKRRDAAIAVLLAATTQPGVRLEAN